MWTSPFSPTTCRSMSMRIDGLARRLIPFAVAALLCLSAPAALAKPWTDLTPAEKEALAPLAQNWGTLTDKRQQSLLKLAQRYPALSPEKKQRFHKQLPAWSKLEAEQRVRAREKYKAFNKLPPEKAEQVRRMVREHENGKAAASGVPPSARPTD